MIEKYLIENGERITHTSELRTGEMYAVGWGKGYKAFRMPGEERITRSNGGDMSVNVRMLQIPSLEANENSHEVVMGRVDLNFVTIGITGTYKLNERSEIRKTVEEVLG